MLIINGTVAVSPLIAIKIKRKNIQKALERKKDFVTAAANLIVAELLCK